MSIKRLTFIICAVIMGGLLTLSDVAAQSIRSVEYYSPPGQPFQVGSQEVAIVNSTGLVYSGSNAFANRVAVIDPNTNTPVDFIQAPAVTGSSSFFYSLVNQTTNLVYFLGQGTANIFVVDGRPSSSTFNEMLPVLNFSGQLVRGVDFDETRGRLYVTTVSPTSAFTGQINIIDANPASPTFHQTLTVVPMPPGVPGYSVAVNPVTNKIYIAGTFVSGGNQANAGVYVLDGANLSLVKIPGTDGGALTVIVNPSSNLIYANGQNVNMYAIDGATNTLLTNIFSVPQVGSNEFLAINKVTGRVYVGTAFALVVIDGNRTSPTFNTELTRLNINSAAGIVVDESLNKIAVVNSTPEANTLIIDGATNAITATIPGQFSPSDVALNPATGRVFVANQLFNVQHINLANNNLVATIPTGADAGTGVISPLNNRYYSPRARNTNDIPFFDANGIAGTVSGLPHNNGRFLRVVQNTVTNRLYAINSGRNAANTAFPPNYVAVINPATNSVIATVEIGTQCVDATVNEATNKVFIFCAGFGSAFPRSIHVIDGATNTASTVNTSAFPANDVFFNGPILANPTANKIYFRTDNGSAGVINGATNVAASLPYTGVVSIAVNKALNRAYVTTATSLRVLDSSTDAEIANIPITSAGVGGIAVNETTGRVFISNPNEDTVTILNGSTNSIIGTVQAGDNPSRIAVNEAENRVYVGNFSIGNFSLTFIDGNSLTVRKTLPLPLPVSSISVSAATKRVYISSSSEKAAAVMIINDTPSSVPYDFDGDGKADLSVFRPSNGTWYLQQSTAGFTGFAFGASGDKIAPADFDGDGKADIAVFRPSNGTWYIQRSSLGFAGIAFGAPEDVPVPADFDGDGKADIAVFRPSNGTWYLLQSTAGFTGIQFGTSGDIPVAGDYDGDGRADIAVFRPSGGVWYLNRSQLGFTGISFGANSDKPVPADYDGDGKTDIAVFRPSDGVWYLQRSTAGYISPVFGFGTDTPVPADYDGDGKTDIAVFRDGTWYLNRTTQGFTGIAFGTSSDKPIPGAFVP